MIKDIEGVQSNQSDQSIPSFFIHTVRKTD